MLKFEQATTLKAGPPALQSLHRIHVLVLRVRQSFVIITDQDLSGRESSSSFH